jgi:hypothetical protein
MSLPWPAESPLELQFRFARVRAVLVVSFEGRVGRYCAGAFQRCERELVAALGGAPWVVLAFRHVAWEEDPLILPALSRLLESVRSRAKLRVCGLDPSFLAMPSRRKAFRPAELLSDLPSALRAIAASG